MCLARKWCLMLVAVAVACLTCGPSSHGDESASVAPGGPRIRLPSGAAVKIASFDAHPKWKECFPPDQPFFAEKYVEGKLQGIHSRYKGRLNGASAMLYENGSLMWLTYYPGGHREGPCRVWDEDKNMLLFAQYKDDKKHGMTCLFKEGVPWFVQEWNMGALENENLVAPQGHDYVLVGDVQQLAQAKQTLSDIEEEIAANESELKKTIHDFFLDTTESINKEKEKTLTKVAAANSKASKQSIRHEKDARVAAYHTHRYGKDRIGRLAAADNKLAKKDLKTASNHAAAVRNEAKSHFQHMNVTMERESKELYHFAIATLEAALPSGGNGTPSHVSGKTRDREDTPGIRDEPSHKKGKKHKKH